MRYQPEPARSLLDRLMDQQPESPDEPVQFSRTGITALVTSVLRDLENLFNTRSCTSITSNGRPAPHADRSILTYGSRDFSLENPRSQTVRQAIRLEIVRLLSSFEPRLKDVTVRLGPTPGERTLSFRIEAVLHIEPVALPTAFDTHFDINSGSYTILS
ncbi:type VI secretion system baseplate subunit TssE [Geomonas terrae]|uniref:Type VI secretion system baseplate subunit TssE n=1 Tax=Geomonas terrae TaxID=2562681 RepID=A0A4S1CEF7_9BACT|nr:type VI secretion system baseplate subunit TssE [Geomonas terrae]TGU71376.1 type VI secretion system baseplate subunit TssE [Geomonas terrae]